MNLVKKSLLKNKHIFLLNSRNCIGFILLVLFSSQQPGASDFAIEERIAEQLLKNKLNGSAVWLKTGNQKFLSLYMEASGPKIHGAVIILHGMAGHPDWPNIIAPLRTGLPEFGWSTLSLQMPLLPPDASVAEYVPLLNEVPPRIIPAIKFFHSKGIYNVVIIGHGLGATMGASFLASGSRSASVVTAFAGIGMGAHSDYPEFVISNYLAKINIPIFDLYGSRDLNSVMNYVHPRFLASRRAKNKAYRQRGVSGADHFFTGMNKTLIKHIKNWLNKSVPRVKFNADEINLNNPAQGKQ